MRGQAQPAGLGLGNAPAVESVACGCLEEVVFDPVAGPISNSWTEQAVSARGLRGRGFEEGIRLVTADFFVDGGDLVVHGLLERELGQDDHHLKRKHQQEEQEPRNAGHGCLD